MKPVPCASLKTGTKVVSWLDLIFSIIVTIVSGGLIVIYEQNQEYYEEFLKNPGDDSYFSCLIDISTLDAESIRIFLILNLTYWLQKFVLGIILIVGVHKNNINLCRFYLISTAALLVLSVTLFLFSILISVLRWKAIPIYSIWFLIREYIFWIVKSFVDELAEINSKVRNKMTSRNFIVLGKCDYAVDMTLRPNGCKHLSRL